MVADGRTLAEATPAELRAVDDRFEPDDLARVDPVASVQSRVTPGGGSHASVVDQIARLRAQLV